MCGSRLQDSPAGRSICFERKEGQCSFVTNLCDPGKHRTLQLVLENSFHGYFVYDFVAALEKFSYLVGSYWAENQLESSEDGNDFWLMLDVQFLFEGKKDSYKRMRFY